jgi:tRNA pseudouridine55 synthase
VENTVENIMAAGEKTEDTRLPLAGIPGFEAGIFLIDKPPGPTSFQMVHTIRRLLGIKKVGHAGTLDPFASGLLIVCAGRPATRLISSIMEGEKEYLATLRLGVETQTQDPEGEVTARTPIGDLTAERIEACLAGFRGESEQVPPKYSALKYRGRPLYFYARKGIEIVKEPRSIKISTLVRTDGCHDLEGDEADLSLRIICGKGTYIRSLAADIGRNLGCGAYLKKLRRTKSGCFSIDGSYPGEELTTQDAKERLLARGLSVEDVCKLLQ